MTRVAVLKGKRSYAAAGKATLRLKLTKAGKRLLRRARKVKLKLRISFTDTAALFAQTAGGRCQRAESVHSEEAMAA